MEEMTTARALNNAIYAVMETVDSFDCTESAAETVKQLCRLMFEWEGAEP